MRSRSTTLLFVLATAALLAFLPVTARAGFLNLSSGPLVTDAFTSNYPSATLTAVNSGGNFGVAGVTGIASGNGHTYVMASTGMYQTLFTWTGTAHTGATNVYVDYAGGDLFEMGTLLDIAFDGTYLWAADQTSSDVSYLDAIDPATGKIVYQTTVADAAYMAPGNPTGFNSLVDTKNPLLIPFMTSGMAYGGGKLWVTSDPQMTFDGNTNGMYGSVLRSYDLSGTSLTNPTDYFPFPDTYVWDAGTANGSGGLDYQTLFSATAGRTSGGLAWDAANNVLLIGTDSGAVYTFYPGTNSLSASPTSTVANGQFIGALELGDAAPNAIPEPSTFLLFGSALVGLAAVCRRRVQQK